MKILQIRFQNLNSLTGEWAIDFTHPEYAANGIFAITGPTGSGKTTLLDAICLALYGRTPRLDRISESTNEIMSRHTGVCSSEIEFETKKGRFRCHWSQRRARQQPRGKLQAPRHEIVDVVTDQVLESRVKDVAKMVEEVTGMSFDQFTRSVLLAQGGFAAFLQASSDERAPILEQITGTEIYSRLSLKVHQRKNEEQQQLALLEKEISAITILTAAEEEATRIGLTDTSKSADEILEHLQNARTSLTWLTNLNTLANDIAALQGEAEGIHQRLRDAAPEMVRLERAKTVQLLDGGYKQLCQLRAQQEKEGIEREKAQQEQSLVDQQQREMLTRRGEAESLVNSANLAYQQEMAVCKEVRELDIKLREADSQVKNVLLEKKAAEKERKAHDKLLQEIQKSSARKNTELDRVKDYLLHHQKDAGLIEDLAALQELVKGVTGLAGKVEILHRETKKAREAVHDTAALSLQLMEIHAKNDTAHQEANNRHQVLHQEVTSLLAGRDLAILREELEKLAERRQVLDATCRLARQIASLQAEIAASINRQQDAANRLEELGRLREVLAEKIVLQKRAAEKQAQIVLLANRIRSYDEERAQLTDGSPCPLCGAKEHPYATASVVQPDKAELTLHRDKEILLGLQMEDASLQAQIATTGEKLGQASNDQEKIRLRLDQDNDEYKKLAGVLSFLPEDIEAELVRVDAERLQVRTFLQDIDRKVEVTDVARVKAERAKDLCTQSLQQRQKAGHTETLAAENCKRLEEEARIGAEELGRALDHATLRMAPYGVGTLSVDSCNRIISDLADRQQKWRQQKENERQIQVDLQGQQINLERERVLVQKQATEIDRIGQQMQIRQDHFTALQKKRHDRYGDKDPDVEEKRKASTRSEAEKNLANAAENVNLLKKNRAVLDERIGALTQSITGRAHDLVRDEQDFLLAITGKGFFDETDFNTARLTDERLTEIAGVLEELTRKEVEINTLLQSRKETQLQESKRHLTELSMAVLNLQIEEKTAALNAQQQQIGMLRGKLRNNDEQRNKQHSRLEALEKQRQECGRWLRLHELIGSSDGKKFRNFAQGITFEMMVSHANRSLRKMTDRYILTRDALQPLELNVIDTYQAGEIRSTKNLSGGESFIVSLALALGLACMASNNVRVDSLFLDEGFGTLDEDSLETALETLGGLQQDGKIIGIISHVPVLQERIATRIQVSPGPAGRSKLQGPGVSGPS